MTIYEVISVIDVQSRKFFKSLDDAKEYSKQLRKDKDYILYFVHKEEEKYVEETSIIVFENSRDKVIIYPVEVI